MSDASADVEAAGIGTTADLTIGYSSGKLRRSIPIILVGCRSYHLPACSLTSSWLPLLQFKLRN